MNEVARQTPVVMLGNNLEKAIARQREMLTDLLTVRMAKSARRLAPLINQRDALEMLLIDEVQQMDFCKFLYVLDIDGSQVTANISREGIDHSHYARNRSARSYMQNIIGVSDFRLSEAYVSKNNRRPSISAIQVIRDHVMKRVGFLGADFDLRELPHTGKMYSEVSQWRQLKGDPAIRGNLFNQSRESSMVDERIDDVLMQICELITDRGVFHAKLHFSSNRATIWLTDDPFRYRLLAVDELINPELCLAWSPHAYPGNAALPESEVMQVLEQFRMLRFMDENIYLRSGSLNIFNGIVGLTFSCDGSHYMDYREFLEKDTHFWFGRRCAV